MFSQISIWKRVDKVLKFYDCAHEFYSLARMRWDLHLPICDLFDAGDSWGSCWVLDTYEMEYNLMCTDWHLYSLYFISEIRVWWRALQQLMLLILSSYQKLLTFPSIVCTELSLQDVLEQFFLSISLRNKSLHLTLVIDGHDTFCFDKTFWLCLVQCSVILHILLYCLVNIFVYQYYYNKDKYSAERRYTWNQ